MLPTKFHGNRFSGSGEEGFLRFLPYMGMVAILVVIWTKYINFLFPFAWRLHMKFHSNWSVVAEKKSFENFDDELTPETSIL